jgi:hypothetical protein
VRRWSPSDRTRSITPAWSGSFTWCANRLLGNPNSRPTSPGEASPSSNRSTIANLAGLPNAACNRARAANSEDQSGFVDSMTVESKCPVNHDQGIEESAALVVPRRLQWHCQPGTGDRQMDTGSTSESRSQEVIDLAVEFGVLVRASARAASPPSDLPTQQVRSGRLSCHLFRSQVMGGSCASCSPRYWT